LHNLIFYHKIGVKREEGREGVKREGVKREKNREGVNREVVKSDGLK